MAFPRYKQVLYKIARYAEGLVRGFSRPICLHVMPIIPLYSLDLSSVVETNTITLGNVIENYTITLGPIEVC